MKSISDLITKAKSDNELKFYAAMLAKDGPVITGKPKMKRKRLTNTEFDKVVGLMRDNAGIPGVDMKTHNLIHAIDTGIIQEISRKEDVRHAKRDKILTKKRRGGIVARVKAWFYRRRVTKVVKGKSDETMMDLLGEVNSRPKYQDEETQDIIDTLGILGAGALGNDPDTLMGDETVIFSTRSEYSRKKNGKYPGPQLREPRVRTVKTKPVKKSKKPKKSKTTSKKSKVTS